MNDPNTPVMFSITGAFAFNPDLLRDEKRFGAAVGREVNAAAAELKLELWRQRADWLATNPQ